MLSDKLRECGVVGAGGAGFPTYVKAQSQVEFVIANGAECEPLIHKDAELMKHFPAEILAGHARHDGRHRRRRRKFGIKTENAESLRRSSQPGSPDASNSSCWAISIPRATSTSWSTPRPGV